MALMMNSMGWDFINVPNESEFSFFFKEVDQLIKQEKQFYKIYNKYLKPNITDHCSHSL